MEYLLLIFLSRQRMMRELYDPPAFEMSRGLQPEHEALQLVEIFFVLCIMTDTTNTVDLD